MYGNSTPELNIVQCIGPEDLNTAGNNGTWVSLADYQSAEIHIFIGDLAGGAAAVTVQQASALAGTGAKALSFTKYYITGQKLLIGTVSGTFVVDEYITGGSSSNTAYIVEIADNYLIVAFKSGSTTWTTGETLTGYTSSATAVLSGTGQNEDILAEQVATSNTFSTIAVTFKHYMIPIDGSMLDVANGFYCVRPVIAQAATGETQGAAFVVLKDPRIRSYPQQSAISTVKIV